VLSLTLALGGATLLVGSAKADWASGTSFGDLLAHFGRILYGAYLLMVKRLRREFSGLTIMFGPFGGLSWIRGGRALLGEDLWAGTTAGWLGSVGAGLGESVGGQTLIAIALGHLPAPYSAVGACGAAGCGILPGWVWFNQGLSRSQILGGVIILAGIGLANSKRQPAAESPLVALWFDLVGSALECWSRPQHHSDL